MSDSRYKLMGGTLGAKAVTIRQFDDFMDYLVNRGSNDGKLAQDLYKQVAWAFWCANLRANNIASVPYAVYPIDTEEDDQTDENTVEWPIDMAPVLWLIEMWLTLTGASYHLKQIEGQMLTGLQSLNANTMKVLDYDADGPTQFVQRVQTKEGVRQRIYDADQIVYLRTFNSYDDINEGTSSGAVGKDASSLHLHANRWASAFFENGAIPSIILKAQGQVSEGDRKEIKNVWKRTLGGIAHFWEVMVVRKGLEVEVVTPPISDLAMPDLERTKRDQILAAHMIPPGLGETKTNRAERDALQWEFWDQGLIPHIKTHLRPMLDEQLFNPLGLKVVFESWKVEAVEREEIKKAEATAFYISGVMSKMYDDNVVSVEEYRRVGNQLLLMGNMPGLDTTFTPEERMPLQLGDGADDADGDDEGMGVPGNPADNIENRASPKAFAPGWGDRIISLQN